MVSSGRINFFIVLTTALMGLIFYRIVYLSCLKHDYYEQLADIQYQNQDENSSKRGHIYIVDGESNRKQAVATQKRFPYIYVIPRQSDHPQDSAEQLTQILNIDPDKSLAIFSKTEDPFEVVKKNPSPEETAAIEAQKSKDIKVGYEDRRYYPEGDFLSQTLGFVGFEGGEKTGRYGLELFYDDQLSPHAAEKQKKNGANSSFFSWSRWFGGGENDNFASVDDGFDLVLTIDKNIQDIAERELNYLMKKWKPESGTIMVQDPNGGAILAMAGSPSFDPNNYGRFPLASFINKNMQEMFEPGSSFKPITMAAALDKKRITPDTTYTDFGEVVIGGYRIRNFNEKSFGVQTMTQVLEKSLNTGAVFVQEQLGGDDFLNYVVNFGFGQLTGIDLPGESAGDIANLYSKRKINFATASFGQGIAVTPLQLINAYSAIANGGKLYRPYLVKEIIGPQGIEAETRPELIGTPVSERVAFQLKSMLVQVVEKGFDKAVVKGYDVAGKTGTAQIASPGGGYSDQFVHNIVGFAPAFSPRFAVLIKLEKPQGIRFASDSLSPSLGHIFRLLLNYYKIPPGK